MLKILHATVQVVLVSIRFVPVHCWNMCCRKKSHKCFWDARQPI